MSEPNKRRWDARYAEGAVASAENFLAQRGHTPPIRLPIGRLISEFKAMEERAVAAEARVAALEAVVAAAHMFIAHDHMVGEDLRDGRPDCKGAVHNCARYEAYVEASAALAALAPAKAPCATCEGVDPPDLPMTCPGCDHVLVAGDGEWCGACEGEQGDNAPCPECDGSGGIITCIDDLCYRREVCIHGDDPTPCPECKGTGRVESDD